MPDRAAPWTPIHRLALWAGLAVASGYCLAVVLALWAQHPEAITRALAAGSYVGQPPPLFILRMLPGVALGLLLGGVVLGGEGDALGALGRTPALRMVTVHLPLIVTPLVLSQDDVSRRPALLAGLIALSVALSVALRKGSPVTVLPTEVTVRGWRGHWPMLTVIALHALSFTSLAVTRDRALWSATVDLGIFKEALWNTLHGRMMFSSTVGYSFLGEHFAPVLFLLVPLYALWPTSACLLTVQTLAVSVSAWPLYLLARELRLGRRLSTALLGAMLFAPTMQGSLLYDFHMDLLGVPALAWLCLAAHRKHWGQATLATALLVFTKEDMFIPAVAVLLGCALSEDARDRQRALTLSALATGYCILAMAVFLPHFGPPRGVPVYMAEAHTDGYKFLRNFRHLRGPGGPLRFLLGEPVRFGLWALTDARLTTLLTLVLPLGLLPAFARRRLPLVAPMGIVLLSDNPEIASLRYHYGAIQHPALYAAAAYGAAALIGTSLRPARLRASLAAFILTAAVVMAALHPASVFSVIAATDAHAVTAHTRGVHSLAREIPARAPVSATTFVGPLVSNRPWVGLFPNGIEKAQWALVDLQRPPWPSQNEQRDEILRVMLRTRWGAVAWTDGAIVLHRDADTSHNPDAVRDLFARRRYEVEGTEQTDFTGCAVPDVTASDGWARVVSPTDPRAAGYIVYGPFLRLPAGAYDVTFRLRAVPMGFAGDIGTVDVHAHPDNTLASTDLTPLNFPDGRWHDVTLSFTVDHEDGLEFRVKTEKHWLLGADVISLHAHDEEGMVSVLLGPR